MSRQSTQSQQHDTQEYYTTSFLAHYLGVAQEGGEFGRVEMDDVLFGHEGARFVRDEISEQGVAVRWGQPSETIAWIDDFNGDQSANPSPDENLLGGALTSTGFARSEDTLTYWQNEEEPPPSYRTKGIARLLDPSGSDAGRFTMSLGEEGVEVDGGATFQARIKRVDASPMPQPFFVELRSGDRVERIDGHSIIGPVELTNRYTQIVAPIPNGWSRIDEVTIEVGRGAVWLDDARIVKKS